MAVLPEYKSLPTLIKDAEEALQYLGEDTVGYMYVSMLDYLKLLNDTYQINIHTKIATKKE